MKEKKRPVNNEDKKQIYQFIKAKFKAVAEDVNILQEKVKENEVIEKVYLKELDRKRN